MPDNTVTEVLDGDADTDEDKVAEPNEDNLELEDGRPSEETMEDIPKDTLSGEDKEFITIEENFEKNDASDLNGDHQIIEKDDKVPLVGMVFKSYDEACHFYKQYAMEVGFGVAVKKSSFTSSGVCRRLIIACSKGGKGRSDACYQARQTAKTNCQAMIVLKSWGDDLLHLVEVKLEHNHPVSPLMARFFNCYKKMAGSKKEEPVPQLTGLRHSLSDEKQCGKSTEIGPFKLVEGDDYALYQFFARMQNKSPNFFYMIDSDSRGRLKNLFWSDGRSRAMYHYFGDVISLDTSFLTEKYDLHLVSFYGTNHHGQLVLLGCGFVSDDTVQTYVWLFKAFLLCMLGHQPHAIVTDTCEAIQDAVAEVLPGVRHRLCLSGILKKIPDKLKGLSEFKAVKKTLKKTVFDSLKTDEFEVRWKKMIQDNSLQNNEWLTSLYENRHSWVPTFLKDMFWASISISQRGESVNGFYDGFVFARTSLKQFLSKYETILESKYKKEAQADYESFHKIPLTISKFYMEEQLSKLYTVNMFRKFQEELKATMYCDASPTKIEGPLITFQVKECSYLEGGKRTETRDLEVLFEADKLEVQCNCGLYEFSGILCRHSLTVFKLRQIYEIPVHHILNRWKKDYKKLHALARCSDDIRVDNVLERYDYLSMRLLQIAELGLISDDRYQVALKLIREVEKSLIDDDACTTGEQRLLSTDLHSTENVQNLLFSQIGISETNKTPESLHAKRRGRPPKKARESSIEALARPNKEQDFLRSPLIGNENNVLQSTSGAAQLDAHMATQGGIDLMEDITANDLSFGTHFGMHVNHQHHISEQSRIQPNNFLQGRFDHQAIGNDSRMQWIYQQMLQEDQITKATPGRRTS